MTAPARWLVLLTLAATAPLNLPEQAAVESTAAFMLSN